MNRGAAALHRLSIGLFALICLALAAAVILYRLSVDPVATWVERLDTTAVADGIGASWFTAVLVALILLALYWGWRLIRTTIAPQKPDELVLDGSDEQGTLTVPLKLVARAVREQLATQTILDHVQVQAIDDRGSKIVRITVQAHPERSYDELVDVLAPAVTDLKTAFDGSDVHVQTFIHLNPLH